MKKIFLLLAILFSTTAIKAQITFSDDFECGSMEKAELISQQGDKLEYDLYSKFDPENPASPTLAPSGRWFYFKMSGVNGKEITLNFKNTDPLRPMYSYDNINWQRFSAQEAPERCKVIKKFNQNEVYVAYFIPYTLTHLLGKIQEWVKYDWVDLSSLGKSEHGRNMPLLTITNNNRPATEKKVVYIHGRVHPSETPGSWHLEGMIDIITSDTPYAQALRDEAVFYILPFTNPDGVIEGMSRSNGEGINLEVNWNDPAHLTSAEVVNMRRLMEILTGKRGTAPKGSTGTPAENNNSLANNNATLEASYPEDVIGKNIFAPTAGKGVDVFLNMHSQVANFVTFWVHTGESTTPKYFKELMLLCNLTINENPYLRKNELSFSKVNSRYLEGWFWDNEGEKTVAITFETPYTHYNNPDGEWLTVENLQKLSWNSVWALGDYLGIGAPERCIISEPNSASGFTKASDAEHFYFGDSYLVANQAGAKIKYTLKNLPAGEYKVYRWSVGESKRVSEAGENEWGKQYGSLKVKRNGKGKIIIKASAAGEKFDSILVYPVTE